MTTRARRSLATPLAILTVLLLVSTAGAMPVSAQPAASARGAASATHAGGPRPAGPPPAAGFSEQTLNLLNQTVVPGNDLPVQGYDPGAVAFDSGNGMVYTLGTGGYSNSTVNVINGTSRTLVANVLLGPGLVQPVALAVAPGLDRLYAVCQATASVAVINTSSNQVVTYIPVGGSPNAIALPTPAIVAFVTASGNLTPANDSVSMINLATNTVTGETEVGAHPNSIVDDPSDGDLYVTNYGSGNVSVLSDSNDSLLATVPVGASPSTIVVEPSPDTVYVLGANLTVINGTNESVVTSTLYDTGAYNVASLAFVPTVDELFVSNGLSGGVGVLSTTNDSWVTNLSVSPAPGALTWDGPLGFVLALVYTPGQVALISPVLNQVSGNVTVARNSIDLTLDSATGTFFVPSLGGDMVQVANGTGLLGNVSVGAEPTDVVIDNATGLVYVSESDAGAVVVYNSSTSREVTTVPTGAGATVMALDSHDNRLYVDNSEDDSVSGLNLSTNTVVSTTAVGNSPEGVLWDPSNDRVFVINTLSQNVSVLNGTTGAVVATIAVGVYPNQMVLDPASAEVFVINHLNGNVSVIDAHTDLVVANLGFGSYGATEITYDPVSQDVQVIGSVVAMGQGALFVVNGSSNTMGTGMIFSTGTLPNAIAIDPTSGDTLVAATTPGNNGTLLVINASASSIVASVGVGEVPRGLVVDPTAGVVVVDNLFSQNVSLVSLANDTVVATFPVGITTLGGAADGLTGDAFLPNYNSGTVTLLTASPQYAVEFTASGLPAGHRWSVTLGGVLESTTASNLTFEEANGTYPFSVSPLQGFVAAPVSGNVTVAGAPVNQTIQFVRGFTATFNETGLPVGTSWSVTLNGTVNTTTGTSATFAVTNGTYPYQIANVPGWRGSSYAGSLLVAGANATVDLTWTPALYAVNFTSSGLPAGRSWAVIVNGTANRTTNGSAGFELPNGTYNYSVAGAPGFAPVPASGTVTVSGAAQSLVVNFTHGYLVEFNETGLAPGTYWAVTLNGSLNFSVTPGIGFEVPNGDFGWVVWNVPGWRADAYTGGVVVSGANRTVNVSFARTVYSVGFNELGLPLGTNWSVTIGNSTSAGSVSTLFLSEPNGSFDFSVGNVPGWRASEYSSLVNVSGGAADVPLFWTQNQFAVTLTESGLPTGTEWSATLNGGASTFSTAPSIVFEAGNGTAEYTIGSVSGFHASQYSGVLDVEDGPTGATIDWTTLTYTVNVTEVGLPSGTTWALTYAGTTTRSTTAWIEFSAPNGTATFNLSNVPGWRADSYNVSVDVAGATAVSKVRWNPATYTLTLTASGLVAGAGWTAVVGGTSYASTGAVVTVGGLANGTYPLSVPSANGQVASGVPASVTIAGTSTNLTVSFGPAPPSPGTSGLSLLEEAGIGIVIAVVVAALLAWLLLRRRRPPAQDESVPTDDGAPEEPVTIVPDPPR
ncbi:MAG: YncE family protein [Thermoplasmata archaeon]|nr:YncE family protein [Thermoplasmata archaeon]